MTAWWRVAGVPFGARERVCYYPDDDAGRRAVSLLRQVTIND